MKCLRRPKHWDRGFQSLSRHGCLSAFILFCVCVVLCVDSGLMTGWSLVQGVLPTVYKIYNSKINSEWKKKKPNPSSFKKKKKNGFRLCVWVVPTCEWLYYCFILTCNIFPLSIIISHNILFLLSYLSVFLSFSFLSLHLFPYFYLETVRRVTGQALA
jgi:hypothetical protein